MSQRVTELVIKGRRDTSLDELEAKLERIQEIAADIEGRAVGPSSASRPRDASGRFTSAGGSGSGGSGGGGGGGSGGSGGGRGSGGGGGGAGGSGGGGGSGATEDAEQRRFGPVKAAAAALPVLGAVGAALIAEYIRTASVALSYDAMQSRSRGLFGGRATGANIRRGSGGVRGLPGTTELGFTPEEGEGLFQQAATAGLDAEGTKTLGRLAAVFERIGVGAGAAVDFGAAFRSGGGAVGDPQAVMGLVFREAVRSGVELARLPDYMGKVAQQMTRLADEGVDVDPVKLLAMAGAMTTASRGDRSFAGTRAVDAAGRALGIADQVRGGGGTPLQQFLMYQAAGLGQVDPVTGQRIDLVEANARLAEGNFNINNVLGLTQRFGRGGALLASQQGFFSERQALAIAGGERAGASPAIPDMGGPAGAIVDLLVQNGMSREQAMGLVGSGALAAGAMGATSAAQRNTAALAQQDLATGQQALPSYLDARSRARGALAAGVQKIAIPGIEFALDGIDKLAAGFNWVSDALGAAGDAAVGFADRLKSGVPAAEIEKAKAFGPQVDTSEPY